MKIINISISFFLTLFLFLPGTDFVFAQCSDAGVCVIGRKNESNKKLGYISNISLNYSYGNSGSNTTTLSRDNKLNFNAIRLDADVQIFRNTKINLSVPFTFISGELGKTSGLGDIIILGNQFIPIGNKGSLALSLGVKLKTGNVNNGDTLPQSYQQGSGTTDLLLGSGFIAGDFSVAAGYQKTFGRSSNEITRLKKGDDLFFRGSYNYTNKNLQVKGEVLVIKRIQKNIMINPAVANNQGEDIEVEGSDFTQVNLLLQAAYKLGDKFALQVSGAIPFLVRSENSDGTRRAFTLGAGFSYIFKIIK